MESGISLYVYFEDPFWVGVIERRSGTTLEAARIVFGAEPTNADVYVRIAGSWGRIDFSPAVTARPPVVSDNPKRRQREAARAVRQCGVSTKSQEALARQREERRKDAAKNSRLRKKDEAEEAWNAKQRKRKEKHRGH